VVSGWSLGQPLAAGTQTGSQLHMSALVLVLSALGTSVPHRGGSHQDKDSVAPYPGVTVGDKI